MNRLNYTVLYYHSFSQDFTIFVLHLKLYGFSLGTGIMFELACKKEYPAAGLILQSPFLSIMRTLYNIKKTFK